MSTDFTGDNNPGKKNRMSQHKILKKERRLQAIQLRKQGLTYAEIGRVMGVTRQAAYSYVEREFKHIVKEGSQVAEKALSLTLARYDELLKAYYQQAVGGDRESLQDVLSIMDRQVKILGLEAPKKSETSITYTTMTDAELVHQATMWGITIPNEIVLENSENSSQLTLSDDGTNDTVQTYTNPNREEQP
jgi:hypothetical protein